MRAERLLSLMMILQTEGQQTAATLAHELAVSQRTIYRDIDALSRAGVPIYANGGPGGGYALLNSYRTTLTGLNEAEIRALFMMTIPNPLTDLGLNDSVKTAVLKLTASLPHRYQKQATYLQQRLHLDAMRWFQPNEQLPHLQTVQTAVWQDRQLQFTYRRATGAISQRTVSPYALVAKAGIWYMVAAIDTDIRVYRLSRIKEAILKDTPFVRPLDFDLAQYWAEWVADYEATLPQYPVTLRVSPKLLPVLPHILGTHVGALIDTTQAEADGWYRFTYTFERQEEAEAAVLSMGALVTVVSPQTLKYRIINIAQAIVAHYATLQ